MRYQPAEIERKWQDRWDQERAFEVSNDLEILHQKPKYYVLDMFPYPSGAGLHVGHPEGYTATDVVARLKRMQGFNVLHPMGWDAFGLPAERAAMRENIHPAIITQANIKNFKRQIKRLGFSYDWSREINTSDASYYKWTQWIFTQMFERDLAYLAEVPVNFCPALGTVLANEEVKDGRYVETGDLVEKRVMRQWMLRITEYAERLLSDLDGLDWPEGVKEMQRNWIGKSIGAELHFEVAGQSEKLAVFTTRPNTLFGATFLVVSPEHPLIETIVTDAQRQACREYQQRAAPEGSTGKTGVFTGAYALHPITQQTLPIWIADYVLMNYGTGAIMAVPAHDERDHAFALQFGLPIVQVIEHEGTDQLDDEKMMAHGKMVASEFLNGLSASEAIEHMLTRAEADGFGTRKVQYRLRDWLFSRQRYWGEPFPVLHKSDGSVALVPTQDLPVSLPQIDAYKPTDDGQPPLARALPDWLEPKLADGTTARRETNTMPQWAGSCWYYLRYLDAHNPNAFCDQGLEQYWMPVDLYIGGVEHAVLHLLYARFWHKVLFDCGLVHTKEPFQRLFNQGMILAQSYQDDQGKYYYPTDIEQKDKLYFAKSTGRKVNVQVEKMSKSRYNVVSPDEVIDQYGADAMRLYELFMGPLEQVKMWQMSGVEGVYRFLQRIWRLVVNEETNQLSEKISEAGEQGLEKSLHKCTKKVEEDILGLRFNTAVSQMMIWVNEATASATVSKAQLEHFLKILSPFAPHIAEELWARLGHADLICLKEWPKYDPALCSDDQVSLVVQVNGKKRDDILMPKDADEESVKAAVLELDSVKKFLGTMEIKKMVVVKNRLVNVVAS